MAREFVRKSVAICEKGKTVSAPLSVLIPLDPKAQAQRHIGDRIWSLFFLDSCKELAQLELTGQEWQVLMQLFSEMGFGNRIAICQSALAKDLGVAPPRVSTAIKKLVAAHVLIPDGKVGISPVFRLNSKFAYRGRARNAKSALRTDTQLLDELAQQNKISAVVDAKIAEIARGDATLEEAITSIEDEYCVDLTWEPERYDFGLAVIRSLEERSIRGD